MSAAMPVLTKICGLSTPETIDAAIAGSARHIGFMIFPPSPRYVAFDLLAGLAARVPAQVGNVGVFVDPDDALIDAAIGAGALDTLQLHRVAPDRAAAIGARFGLPVWVAVAVKARADLQMATRYVGAADMILYDAKPPEGSTLPGGNGVRFDWGLLEGFRHPLPWILSGGLDAQNVGEAIRQTGAALVDVSSGVESAPGVKDVAKISSFLQSVANVG
jgi:phosphoribosylanthranilate isomerase